jgi:hypothetical protein
MRKPILILSLVLVSATAQAQAAKFITFGAK